jgi:hypothetical protein
VRGNINSVFAPSSVVFIWRQHWTPAEGMTEEAAFMPFVGHVNAAFFAENELGEFLHCGARDVCAVWALGFHARLLAMAALDRQAVNPTDLDVLTDKPRSSDVDWCVQSEQCAQRANIAPREPEKLEELHSPV